MENAITPKVCIIDDYKRYLSLVNMLIKKYEFANEILVFANGQ
jgi:hypothetical protein